MKRIFIIATISFCFIRGFAQQGLDSMIKRTKFRIVRTTLQFLSTDRHTFPDAGKVDYQSCNGYSDLINAAEKDKLNKAGALVEFWKQKKPTLNTIAAFSKSVSDTISTGQKSFRRQLAGYEKYMTTLKKLIDTLNNFAGDNPAKSNKSAGQQNEPSVTIKLQPVDPPTDPKNKSDSLIVQRLAEMQNNISTLDSQLGSYRDMLYFLIVLLLAGAGYLIYLRRTQNISVAEDKKKLIASLSKSFEGMEDRFQQKIDNLSSQLSSTSDKLDHLKKEMQRKTRALTDQPPVVNPPVADSSPATSLSRLPMREIEPSKYEKAPEPAEPRIKYAKYADLDDGFSNYLLQDETSEETIFEITFTSISTASFKIANNSKSQKYALTNPAYLLSKACKYDTTPNSNSTITTQKDGELRLEGVNWRITERAKITFS